MLYVMTLAVISAIVLKFDVTKLRRLQIRNAILRHNADRRNVDKIGMGCFEPFWRTYLRLWDWGCANIIPRWYYCKIGRYMR